MTDFDASRGRPKSLGPMVAALTTSTIGGVACGVATELIAQDKQPVVLVVGVLLSVSLVMLGVRGAVRRYCPTYQLLSCVTLGFIAGPCAGIICAAALVFLL